MTYNPESRIFQLIAIEHYYNKYVGKMGNCASDTNKESVIYLLFFPNDYRYGSDVRGRICQLYNDTQFNCYYSGKDYKTINNIDENVLADAGVFRNVVLYLLQLKEYSVDLRLDDAAELRNLNINDILNATQLFMRNFSDDDYLSVRQYMSINFSRWLDFEWNETTRDDIIDEGENIAYLIKKLNYFMLEYDTIPLAFCNENAGFNMFHQKYNDIVSCLISYVIVLLGIPYHDGGLNYRFTSFIDNLFLYKIPPYDESEYLRDKEKYETIDDDKIKAGKTVINFIEEKQRDLFYRVYTNNISLTKSIVNLYVAKCESQNEDININLYNLYLSKDKESSLKKCVIDVLYSLVYFQDVPNTEDYLNDKWNFELIGRHETITDLIKIVSDFKAIKLYE